MKRRPAAQCSRTLPTADVTHFSCHGVANWSDPENSGFMMAKNELLTVKDLFELHLEGARLATLSACETGVPGTRHPDEVVSLPLHLHPGGICRGHRLTLDGAGKKHCSN